MRGLSAPVRWRELLAGVVAAGAVGAAPAFAHHSFAMFDQAKTVEVPGTLINLEFANPHVWMKVMAPNKAGKPVVWAIEMGAVQQVRSMGITPDTLKPGDKLAVSIHPMRNGAVGGSFVSAKLPDGHEFIHRGVANPGPPQARP
jgi:hypothetical protein